MEGFDEPGGDGLVDGLVERFCARQAVFRDGQGIIFHTNRLRKIVCGWVTGYEKGRYAGHLCISAFLLIFFATDTILP